MAQTRQPARSPNSEGGQYTSPSRPEPAIHLAPHLDPYQGDHVLAEALADAEGFEDPFYDEDDPFHADLVEVEPVIDDALIALGYLRKVNERARKAGFVDGADSEVADVDEMSPGERDRFEEVRAHARVYAEGLMGTSVIVTSEEAEQYASYVGARLVAAGFDDTWMDHTELIWEFDRERALRLAVAGVPRTDRGLMRGVVRVGSPRGVTPSQLPPQEAVEVSTAMRWLSEKGYALQTSDDSGHPLFRLIGGRPHDEYDREGVA